MKLVCTINGEKVEKEADPCKRLLDFLRDDCGLTGVKEGCSEGECGACTVLLDQKAVTSCTVFTGQVMGKEIITIEGLEKDGELDVLQKAFREWCDSVRFLYAWHDSVVQGAFDGVPQSVG